LFFKGFSGSVLVEDLGAVRFSYGAFADGEDVVFHGLRVDFEVDDGRGVGSEVDRFILEDFLGGKEA
jgi:hypothetical protein